MGMMMLKSDDKQQTKGMRLWGSEKQIRFVNPADNLTLVIPMTPVITILVVARDVVLRSLEY